MKTIAVIGNSGVVPELESVVKPSVENLLKSNKIITGGATWVDTFVIETALELNLTKNLSVYLTDPIENLDKVYAWKTDYGDNDELKKELNRSKNVVKRFIELQPENVIEDIGENRNKRLAQDADRLFAFMSKVSKGTMETIKYAKEMDKKVTIWDEKGEEIQLSDLL